MTRTRVLAVAVAALLAVPAAASAGIRAPLRVVTADRTVFGQDATRVGATRTYLDDAGAAHVLPPNTVMGQLIAGAAAAGLDVGASFNTQFNSAFVSSIGGVAAPATGFWALFVDGKPSQTGADTTFLHRGADVVWLLDPDFSKAGPFFLDLDIAVRSGRSITFRVTRAGGAKPVPARGATLIIAGKRIPVPASGRVRVHASGSWSARATLPGTIRSETLHA